MGLCIDCVDDVVLKEKIRTEGKHARCMQCGRSDNLALDIQTLALLVKSEVEDHFDLHVDLYRGYDGLELEQVVGRILGKDFAICADIARMLAIPETDEPFQDLDQFFGEWQSYQPTRLPDDAFYSWNDAAQELKHARRFFSQRVIEFFRGLVVEAADSRRNTLFGMQSAGAVSTMRAGSIVFRARRADSPEAANEILQDPQKHLRPPPPARTSAGRMNPMGVPVFYGAEAPETCIAEVRPSIGHTVIVGAFKVTRQLKLFNFCKLDNTLSHVPLSYFDPDYGRKKDYRRLVRELHERIAQPVLPGAEHEYLITQALSEYLAYVHDEPFDGVKFSSVQHKGGVNVVLFPGTSYRNGEWFDRAGDFPVEWANKLPTSRVVEAIAYETRLEQPSLRGVPFEGGAAKPDSR